VREPFSLLDTVSITDLMVELLVLTSAWLHGFIAMEKPGDLNDGQDFSSTGQGFNILNLGLKNNKSEEQMLKEVVHRGGHIIIISMGSEQSQILAIVKQLRAACLPETLLNTPIVILDDTNLTVKEDSARQLRQLRSVFAKLEGVVYVQGSALKLDTIVRIGADQCSKIVIISGCADVHVEPIMADQGTILLLSMLEAQEPLWGKIAPTVCLLNVPKNVLQIPETHAADRKEEESLRPKKLAKKVFNTFDVDRGGQLDARELKNALALMGMQLDEHQISAFLKVHDADQSGVLEFLEFEMIVQEAYETLMLQVLKCTCFTSARVQILTPEGRRLRHSPVACRAASA
jgi:hypothetical protein